MNTDLWKCDCALMLEPRLMKKHRTVTRKPRCHKIRGLDSNNRLYLWLTVPEWDHSIRHIFKTMAASAADWAMRN